MFAKRMVMMIGVAVAVMFATMGCSTGSRTDGSGGSGESASYERGQTQHRLGPRHRGRPRSSLHIAGRSRRALPGGTVAKSPSGSAGAPGVSASGEASAPGEGEAPGATKTANGTGESVAEAEEGFAVQTLTEGKGAAATMGSSVVVKLEGRLEDGTVFQQLEQPAGPWPVDRLMPGLARGIDGMAVGGRRRVTVPPRLAYGDREIVDRETGEVLIPAGAALVYEVELVAIERRGASDAGEDESAAASAATDSVTDEPVAADSSAADAPVDDAPAAGQLAADAEPAAEETSPASTAAEEGAQP